MAASQGDGQHVAAIIQTGSQRYKRKYETQERHDLAITQTDSEQSV